MGKNNRAQASLAYNIQEDHQSPLVGFKISDRLFFSFSFSFSPKYKIIRPEAEKGTKEDPERDQKTNTNNLEKIQFAIIHNLHFISYFLFLFFIIITLLLFYFIFISLPSM